MSRTGKSKKGPDTELVSAGRDPSAQHGFVNTPVYHGSTVLYASADDLFANRIRYSYGRRNSPTIEALTCALSELENAAGTVLAPSGLSAVTTALLSVCDAGDHILVADSVYHPNRHFCDTVLKRMGVETSYYDPLLGADIAGLFKPNTKAVFTESPGSLIFEVQDLPAIAEAAHKRGALVLCDNTWATPYFFKPLDFGADLSIQAGTKYISGHADVLIGSISANQKAWPRLHATHGALGLSVGPDDIFLALRGLRTMGVRLKHHQISAITVARWLEGRPEVARVLHPGLDSDPGHALWKRDFSGASGLFAIELKPAADKSVRTFLDALELFGMGYSWGGYESLIVPFDLKARTIAHKPAGQMLRLHIGLEEIADLIADLESAFAAMKA
ncbi:cystathionine beta-lyase [Terrihabitans soli]|uniref:Cystathionine beta-lyase n=1 Tax=Terrihabitans soli TaxID=708113 RepID=A0A6S6QS89_9HYPH|nr:cystathionine beta-lyase [Terrihabitans soli]BCJ90797.1 cystathionine beta-lyase [Terrihabitans soli]